MQQTQSHATITTMLLGIFAAAANERFEDGVETDFSRALVQTINKHGTPTLDALETLIAQNHIAPRLAEEALNWLGHMDDPATHIRRREVLERCLRHNSGYVRYGAAVGLAYLDDPAALPALVAALAHESAPVVREYIEETIEELEVV